MSHGHLDRSLALMAKMVSREVMNKLHRPRDIHAITDSASHGHSKTPPLYC